MPKSLLKSLLEEIGRIEINYSCDVYEIKLFFIY